MSDFVKSWKDHVSESALEGHKYLKRGVRRDRGQKLLNDASLIGGAGAITAGTAGVIRGGALPKAVRSPLLAAGLTAGVIGVAGRGSAKEAERRARYWNEKAGKIKFRGKQRQAAAKSKGA